MDIKTSLNWNSIEELRKNFIDDYIKTKRTHKLESEYNYEKSLIDDYNGRQILELLQNVDDAYRDKVANSTEALDDFIEIDITFENNILSIGNTGTAFTAETIERLCEGGASSKSYKNIGNKGIGFRSLLNDAEWIELYSADFSIRFSEEFSNKCFEKYKNYPIIVEQLNGWVKEYPLSFPVMRCPQEIDKLEHNYDTLIKIKLKEDNISKGSNSIKSQLEQPFYKSLLFLPYINQIKIKTDDRIMKFSKISDDFNAYIEVYENGKIIEKNDYILRKKIIEVNQKNAELIIAVPNDLNYDFGNEKLYCYFPIRNALTPVNAIIHAPFKTNSSRDNISPDNNNINQAIFVELQKFIKETAEYLARDNKGFLASNMVALRSNYALWAKDAFDLNENYLDILSSAKILETVNNDFISIDDKPKQIKTEYPTCFKGEFFKDLLKYIKSDSTKNFLKRIASHVGYEEIEFDSDDLKNRINQSNVTWSKETNIDVFIWWNENIGKDKQTPNLLFNTENEFVRNDDVIFLPTSTGISEAPKDLNWVKLCILNKEDIDILISRIKNKYLERWESIKDKYASKELTGDMRTLASYSDNYFSLKFKEQASYVQMISTINTQIDSFDKSKSFTIWFFRNYFEKMESDSTLSNIQFRFPTNTSEFIQRDRIYIGEEYDNGLAIKLFKDTNHVPLYDFKNEFSKDELKMFIDFILKCGVKKFPIFELKALEDLRRYSSLNYDKSFLRYISNKYSHINYNVNYLITGYIDNFEILIKSLNTKEIVEWFKKDYSLSSILKSSEKSSVAKNAANHSGDFFYTNEYIKFILNKTKWITIDGSKYSPNDIILYDRLGDLVSSLYGIKGNELIKLIGRDLYENLNFRRKLTDFSDSQIHMILSELSKKPGTEIISRKLYREIILAKKEIKPIYKVDDFKVLCKDGNYYNSSEVLYADKKVSKSVNDKYNFVDINVKLSTETIKNWLNVDRYTAHYQYKNHISYRDIMDEFSAELVDIKTCVKSVTDDNDGNVFKTKKVLITPCIAIVCVDIADSNTTIEFEDYFYIEENGTYFIKIPSHISSMSELRKNTVFSSTIVEIFKQALTLEIDENLLELLISRDKYGKQDKIKNIYGKDRWSEAYKILFDEDPLNIIIYDFFKENKYILDKGIDFTRKLDLVEIKILISGLIAINKDIDDINSLDNLLNVDIRPYLQSKVREIKEIRKDEFENKLFNNLLNKDKEDQEKYFKRIQKYNLFEPILQDTDNSILFDANIYLEDCFSILREDSPEKSYKDVYKENYETLNPENLYISDIQNNNDVRTQIYFLWEEEFKQWLNTKEKESDEPNVPENEVYAEFKNTIPTKVDIEHKKPVVKIKRKNSREVSWNDDQENRRNKYKKIRGNKAELLIYNVLCEQYGKENVTPISEAFVALGILKAGQSKSGNYDIKYKDSEGKVFFVEVKSGEGNKFFITESEYKFAKDNPDLYKVYLVNNFESDPPEYVELPFKFWKDPKFRVKEVVEKYNVDF